MLLAPAPRLGDPLLYRGHGLFATELEVEHRGEVGIRTHELVEAAGLAGDVTCLFEQSDGTLRLAEVAQAHAQGAEGMAIPRTGGRSDGRRHRHRLFGKGGALLEAPVEHEQLCVDRQHLEAWKRWLSGRELGGAPERRERPGLVAAGPSMLGEAEVQAREPDARISSRLRALRDVPTQAGRRARFGDRAFGEPRGPAVIPRGRRGDGRPLEELDHFRPEVPIRARRTLRAVELEGVGQLDGPLVMGECIGARVARFGLAPGFDARLPRASRRAERLEMPRSFAGRRGQPAGEELVGAQPVGGQHVRDDRLPDEAMANPGPSALEPPLESGRDRLVPAGQG